MEWRVPWPCGGEVLAGGLDGGLERRTQPSIAMRMVGAKV